MTEVMTINRASTERDRRHLLGVTMIELLIVLAILGVVLALGVFNGRQALASRQEQAAINTIRQSIWQGATAASSRGRTVTLNRTGRILELRAGEAIIRRDELPSGITINLPQGIVLEFNPPGKVVPETLTALMDTNPSVSAGGRTYLLEVSLIGEVRATGGL